MAFKTVILEKRERIAYLIFNRPEVKNAINVTLLDEIGEVIKRLGKDEEILALVVTGAGKAFMAGADIAELSGMSPYHLHIWNHSLVDILNTLERFNKPVLAAINGFALGGGLELALACDIRIACEEAKLGLPEVRFGIIPGAGGTQRLPRLIGRGAAMELMLTGKMIDAKEAYRMGLVNRVVPCDILMSVTGELATQIIANGPVALQLVKDAVRVGADLSLEAAIEYGHKNVVTSFTTEDAKEGLSAFIEKRSPKWHGR